MVFKVEFIKRRKKVSTVFPTKKSAQTTVNLLRGQGLKSVKLTKIKRKKK